MSFCDSHLFEINQEGVPLHKRDGETYADKTINGVSFDKTIGWENQIWNIVEEEKDSSPHHWVMVGDKNCDMKDIQERTASPGKEKGDGKFYRVRSLPNKKKKYPTKPRAETPWNKRLSRVAIELDSNICLYSF